MQHKVEQASRGLSAIAELLVSVLSHNRVTRKNVSET